MEKLELDEGFQPYRPPFRNVPRAFWLGPLRRPVLLSTESRGRRQTGAGEQRQMETSFIRMRNLLGWPETRPAQIILYYIAFN